MNLDSDAVIENILRNTGGVWDIKLIRIRFSKKKEKREKTVDFFL